MATPAPDVSAIGAALRSPAATVSEADVEKLRLIEELTSDVDAVQERVLSEILGRNAGAEYLTRCGHDAGDTGRATFRAKVPVVSYDDLKPYIQRVADGDCSPVLSTHPITEFLTSSGTSAGECKLIPVAMDDSGRRQALHGLIGPVLKLYVPGLEKGKGLYFMFVKSETKTRGGLTAWFALTSVYKSEQFKSMAIAYTSPTAAILCEDAFQSMYAQMVCGLCQRHDVVRFGAVFAAALVRAIRFLQLNWGQLAADIEAGELGPHVADPSVREAVSGILRPDAELAEFVRIECSKGDWAGIITRIWPNTKYVDAIVTGAMAQYIRTLQYYSGGLPIVSTSYASSECFFGINLRPVCDPSEVSYTIMPNMAYFEFLPVGEVADATNLVDLARVEVGREYEVVITTYAGLSRYRVGDVLRVTGFHNAAPQFRFVRRQSVLLSVELDKTDEAELHRAVERASSALLRPRGVSVAEYTSRACTERIPGHYVVYWELLTESPVGAGDGDTVDGETLGRCCLEMEEALSAVYRQGRVADGSIGPLEIRIVRPGTFEEVMDLAVSRGTSIGQYKVPRCVTVPSVVELLDSRVVSSQFSPALPHWIPTPRSD
ncbi:probable indole-3-acetic acid-amido synthetase GH3.9 isoform X1 [Oryza glaberrima]|uniref:Uncharacterized protein n=2 Tax=Oryza TaxID=4527 RepID=A0A0D3GSQ8_9ORYZ|nr:probable indole-3-acetic acid-amido synthetase GH3.9 isoform X1 [Oryza glaberrima]